jgi:hypothetical protein
LTEEARDLEETKEFSSIQQIQFCGNGAMEKLSFPVRNYRSNQPFKTTFQCKILKDFNGQAPILNIGKA